MFPDRTLQPQQGLALSKRSSSLGYTAQRLCPSEHGAQGQHVGAKHSTPDMIVHCNTLRGSDASVQATMLSGAAAQAGRNVPACLAKL